MKRKQFIQILLTCFSVIISGCISTKKPNNSVMVGEKNYPLDTLGRVVLTQQEIDQFQQQGQAIYINNVLPSGAIVMTPDEMTLLTSSPDVFYRFLDKVSPRQNQYRDVMINRGNIRLNIEKQAKKLQWHVNYMAKEYFIEKPFLVNAKDFKSLILEIVAEFPVYITFNETQKIVFIQQQTQKPIKQLDTVNINNADIREETHTNGHFKQYTPSGRVSFELNPGLLKPQITALLTNHELIKSSNNVKWLVNHNYQWSSHFTAQAPSLDELIQQLVQPYGLRVDFKANGIALVINQEEARQP